MDSYPLLHGQLPPAPWTATPCIYPLLHGQLPLLHGQLPLLYGQLPPAPWTATPCSTDSYSLLHGQLPPALWTGTPCSMDSYPLPHVQLPPAPWTASPCSMDSYPLLHGQLPSATLECMRAETLFFTIHLNSLMHTLYNYSFFFLHSISPHYILRSGMYLFMIGIRRNILYTAMLNLVHVFQFTAVCIWHWHMYLPLPHGCSIQSAYVEFDIRSLRYMHLHINKR